MSKNLFKIRLKRGSILFFTLLIFLILINPNYALSGEGTLNNPYLISNCLELNETRNNLSAHYKLVNDIDCSDTVNWNSGSGFIPIGHEYVFFNGSFDGGSHSIKNLYINNNTLYIGGLFSEINVNASITNLKLINVTIIGGNSIGGLAGYNFGNIANVHVTGTINASHSVGGITSDNFGVISNSSANVTIFCEWNYAGGICRLNGNIITNSYSFGKVNGNDNIGGLVGDNYDGTINNSYSFADVFGLSDNIGGLVGTNSGGVYNSYSTGDVLSLGVSVGGLVGYNFGTISNSFSTSNVSGADTVGGLVGDNSLGTISNSFWYKNDNLDCYSGGNTGCTNVSSIEYFYNYSNPPMDSWDFGSSWSNYYSGSGFPVFQSQQPNKQHENVTTSGSGKKRKYRTYYTDEKFSTTGNYFNLRYKDKVKFSINNTNHTLIMYKFDSKTAKIQIFSEPIDVSLTKDVFVELDLNNDSLNDVKVMYYGLNGTKAILFIKEILNILSSSVLDEKNNSDDQKESYMYNSHSINMSYEIKENKTILEKPQLVESRKDLSLLNYIFVLIIIIVISFILFNIYKKKY